MKHMTGTAMACLMAGVLPEPANRNPGVCHMGQEEDMVALGYYEDQMMGDDGGEVGAFPFFAGRARPQRRPARMPAGYAPQMAPQMAPRQHIGQAVPQFAQMLAPPQNGASRNPGVRETTVAGNSLAFPASAVGTGTVTFTPFKRFKPTRLLVGYASTGTPGVLVYATSAQVADRNQFGGIGAQDINAAFSSTATFVSINWDIIDQNTPLVMAITTVAALAAASTITQSFTLFGYNLNY